MLNSLKQSLLFTLANAGLIDYLAYACVFIAFVLLLFIGLFIASKSWWQFGFLFILASFISLFVGLFYAHEAINTHLRPVKIGDVLTKQLQYSNALMVDFNLTNNAKKPMRICKVSLGFYLASNEPVRDFANSLNPFARKTIITTEPLAPSQTRAINEFVDEFSFTSYKITKNVECFE